MPLLPANVVTLDSEGLHDAVVTSCVHNGSDLTMTLDARGTPERFCGHQVTLRFSSVASRVASEGLVGQWWLYEEVHLLPKPGFSLHVMLTGDDLQIDADDLTIELDS